jgi:hypothetical protein
MFLKKIYSGTQTGADIAGLIVAKEFGIETGGFTTKGFRTQDGKKPEYAKIYNIKEMDSFNYADRTYENVKNSDGTIRIYYHKDSAGEKCTLNAIKTYSKPYFDVDLNKDNNPELAVKWIKDNHIKCLNVAGNSESTALGITQEASDYLRKLFLLLKNY